MKKIFLSKSQIRKMKKNGIVCGIVLLILLILFIVNAIIDRPTEAPDDALTVSYLDVGQGDAALITTPEGEHLLIDTGPYDETDKFLSALRPFRVDEIDYLILSHGHSDHIGGVPELFARYRVRETILPGKNFADKSIFSKNYSAIKQAERCVYMDQAKEPYRFTLNRLTVTVFPSPKYTDNGGDNNDSLIVLLQYGECGFLFCGDSEVAEEQALLEQYGKSAFRADVIKMGHHGSSTSSGKAWMDAVDPEVAVISCGLGNPYGHPHYETMQLLEDRSIKVLRTDEDGTVTLWCDGTQIGIAE